MCADSIEVRELGDQDLNAVTRFLTGHATSSMFLLSNAGRAGLVYSGRDYSGQYWGALDAAGDICGVIAHFWNGNMMVQAPKRAALDSLAERFRQDATRPVAGLLGDDVQVGAVLERLGLATADFSLDGNEGLFALELDALRRPEPAHGGALRVALARMAGPEVLARWVRAYEIEALGAEDGPTLTEKVRDRVDGILSRDDTWVLFAGARPVSLSGFNATLPEMVQVGPVWTPPEDRSRGYARYLVAATLAMAGEAGVKRAILFTDVAAAVRAYESIGFRRIGTYRIALLRDPISVA